MKRAALFVAAVLVLAVVFRAGVAYGQQKYGTPKTVIHVVTGKWKAEATDEQKKAALEGVRTMASKIPGIKNVWLKADRIQPREYNYAFAIEFESRAAAAAYAEHPAHEEWDKPYQIARQESRSQQLTNE
ncbi:MAG: Dabb family protein [Acidobacteria bacterium]|nr:Dabb family protein [Acidobacteriota bacterium]